MLELYAHYCFLSHDLVMAHLKMVNKHRNILDNFLTNLCICWNSKSVKLKMHGTEHCRIIHISLCFLGLIEHAVCYYID
jgi:hypothetical protein